MTIVRKIRLGLAAIAALVVLTAVFYLAAVIAVDGPEAADRETGQKLDAVSSTVSLAVAANVTTIDQGLLSGGLSGGTPAALNTNVANADAALADLKDDLGDGKSATQLAAVAASFGEFKTASSKAIAAAQNNDVDTARLVAASQVNPAAQKVATNLTGLTKAVSDDLDGRADTRRVWGAAVNYVGWGFRIAAVVLSVVLLVLLPGSISRQIHAAVDTLGGATDRVRSIAAQVASGAVQTATAISEAATTVDEVRQTSLLASQKSTALSDRAEEAEAVADSGRQAVNEIVEGMQDIHGQMNVVAETIVRLSEQTQAAEEIIAASNQVAEQSNLLSVNAALEAAKAKEHGKGFGVVAEEMRNLAAQSKKAVQQIRTILADIQKATGEAVMAAEKSGKVIETSVARAQGSSEAIESLADSVEMSAQSSKQIAASSQQQLVGMDQISESMESINSAGSQNAQAAQQMESEVGRLQGVSTGLLGMIVAGGAGDDVVAEVKSRRRIRVPSLLRRSKKTAAESDGDRGGDHGDDGDDGRADDVEATGSDDER